MADPIIREVSYYSGALQASIKRAFVVPESLESESILGVIHRLKFEDIPLEGSVETVIALQWGYSIRIPNTNLYLNYQGDNQAVFVLSVVRKAWE